MNRRSFFKAMLGGTAAVAVAPAALAKVKPTEESAIFNGEQWFRHDWTRHEWEFLPFGDHVVAENSIDWNYWRATANEVVELAPRLPYITGDGGGPVTINGKPVVSVPGGELLKAGKLKKGDLFGFTTDNKIHRTAAASQ